jgi:phosphoadenosine phosphosulfate reductase
MDNSVSNIITESRGFDARELSANIIERFGNRAALATSFSLEDQVLTDMLMKISKDVVIFTLDTGRLPEETYEVMDRTRQKYAVDIKVLFPDRKLVEEMVNKHGPNLFYDSIENRKLCCRVRKLEPLKRQLADLDAWICGLRSEQSVTRTGLERVAWDEQFDIIKVCPLADWTIQQVRDYIKQNDVPYNKLHDKGYPSIGCDPCTRAVEPNEDLRSGRWWWEDPEQKECGLHLGDRKNKKESR